MVYQEARPYRYTTRANPWNDILIDIHLILEMEERFKELSINLGISPIKLSEFTMVKFQQNRGISSFIKLLYCTYKTVYSGFPTLKAVYFYQVSVDPSSTMTLLNRGCFIDF